MLGGTKFLGIHLVERLSKSGFDVVLCNRGETNPSAFPGLTTLIGDRDGDMSVICDGEWDTVYDLSGYTPGHVEAVADAIGDETHYVFVSTINVYSDMSGTFLSENSPVMDTPLAGIDSEAPTAYGALKALAERVVRQRFTSHTIIRPAVISGPLDPSDRLTYWVTRWAESGPRILPTPSDVPLQFIDVRDLANWLLALHASPANTTFNAAAPQTTLREFLDEVTQVAGSQVAGLEISEAFMKEYDVVPWVDMPMWLPPSDTEMTAFFQVDPSAATKAGLTTRPVAETIRGILDWADAERLASEPRHGLSRTKEQELLRKVRA